MISSNAELVDAAIIMASMHIATAQDLDGEMSASGRLVAKPTNPNMTLDSSSLRWAI